MWVQMGPDKIPVQMEHRLVGVIYGSRWVLIKSRSRWNTGQRGLYMGPDGSR